MFNPTSMDVRRYLQIKGTTVLSYEGRGKQENKNKIILDILNGVKQSLSFK